MPKILNFINAIKISLYNFIILDKKKSNFPLFNWSEKKTTLWTFFIVKQQKQKERGVAKFDSI